MILQNVVWTIALVGIGLIAAGFLYVVAQAGKPLGEDAARRSGALRTWLFAALLIVLLVGSWATLRHFPIPPQHGELDAREVVEVVGQQWSWQIDPSTVHAGNAVEFRVTSADVNHGFAIYAPDGHIVIQTQAMPGYTNKILQTFDQPGTYTIRCLEYCGLGHSPMTAELQVVAKEGE